jgi:hypothetical protein
METKTREEIKYLSYRKALLPEQLARARRRYIGLVREARRMKMNWVLTNKELYSDEYD